MRQLEQRPRGAPSSKPTGSVLCSTRSVMAGAPILTQSGRLPCVGSVKEKLSGRAKNRRCERSACLRRTFWAAVAAAAAGIVAMS